MNCKNAFLVVGADSLVGGAVVQALQRRGHKVYASTRRADTVNEQRVLLDFEAETPFQAPADVGCALVIAAATNYDRCETDPLARRINVELIPQLVVQLLNQELFVTFISTNSVFGGEKPWPHEDDPHAPGIAYAQQKSDGEAAILRGASAAGTTDRLSILRLTKILTADVPPLPGWIDAWRKGEVITPFADLIFAPMSVGFAADSIAKIGELRLSGNLHLSGAANVSYVEFAQAVARKLGIPEQQIGSTTATEKGVHIAFKPSYSGLGMTRTTELTGIEPQKLEDVVSDLTANVGPVSETSR